MASSLYGPKPGCTFCGIVQQGQRRDSALDEPLSPSNSNSQYEILHKDTDFTCWREKNNPVSSKAHVILAFKCVFDLVQSTQSILITAVACMCRRYTPLCVRPTSSRTRN